MKLKNYIFFLFFLCSAFVGHSATYIVTNGDDTGAGSLRQAVLDVDIAGGINDSIIINFKGSIELFSPIEISGASGLTIIGPYAKHSYFGSSAAGYDDMFVIRNSTLSFFNMGFWNPTPGDAKRAADIDSSSTISFVSCLFEGCAPVAGDGGALSVKNNSSVRIRYCSFVGNTSLQNGGAIYFDSTANLADIKSTSFIQNRAADKGGAVCIHYTSATDNYTFIGNTFYDNAGSTVSTDSAGHALFVNYPATQATFDFNTYIVLRNNLLYLNGVAGQSQVMYPYQSFSGNFNATVTHNYYYAFNNSTILPDRFTNGVLGADYFGNQADATHPLNLRSNYVTDGYGLKYFTLLDGSFLIDRGTNTSLSNNDCRRAPRTIDGDNNTTGISDIGAAEYTPYKITGSPNAGNPDWRVLVNNINASVNPTDVHYVEFDLSNAGVSEVPVQTSTAPIIRTVYIDGFSQDGSAIPGPNNVEGLSSDTLTPARNLPILRPQGNPTSIDLDAAPNSIISGLSIIGFNEYGILVGSSANGTTIFGNTIGIRSNISPSSVISSSDGNEYGGICIKGEDVVLGGVYHHQRNVITGNGFNDTSILPLPDPYTGANISVGDNANNIKIQGNVIGLHPNGKDSTVKNETNNPHGIYIGTPTNSEIGVATLFGKNIIGLHNGDGIVKLGSSIGTIIDNNHIGVTFDGLDTAPNNHGIYLINDSITTIGNGIGNIISANDSAGIRIVNGQSIKILGNIIGADRSVTANNFGNKTGIYCTGNTGSNASPVLIGGDNYNNTSERNTIVNNEIGIYLSGSNVEEVQIKGNLIGVPNYIGTSTLPNNVGVKIDSGAHHNYIGYLPSSGLTNQFNVISGNTDAGVWVDGAFVNNNRVASNIIGGAFPAAAGPLLSVGNGTGIRFSGIQNSTFNSIGNENDADLKLVIVGNDVGAEILSSSGIAILNSNIGIDTNSNAVANDTGIFVFDSDIIGIGGAGAKSNRISGNDSIGIYVLDSKDIIVAGNLIGTDKDGSTARPNRIGIKIYRGSDVQIGQNESNIISGNRVGLVLDSTENNTIRNNYFGLSADGTFKISGSYYGILARDLFATNNFGVAADGVLGRNYFANDTVDISLDASQDQNISNNVFGYRVGGLTLVGANGTGIGLRLRNSKRINVGGTGVSANNVFGNRNVGVYLQNADSVQVQRCNFGVDRTGMSFDIADNQNFGVGSRGNSSHNIIGPNNVFGENRVGIGFSNSDEGNKIYGNYFGIDTLMTGPNMFENDTAIYLFNSSQNNIGFGGDSANQIINYDQGIVLRSNADSNVFVNNYIGKTSSGIVGSNIGTGVVITGSFRNRFGSSDVTDKNVIAHNNGSGISVVSGSSGNSFLRNSIYLNGGQGIDLGGGNAVNNIGATGIQDGMHTPILNSAFTCAGANFSMDVEANNLTVGDVYYFDFYSANDDTLDVSTYGEGGKSVYFDTITASAVTENLIFDLTGTVAIGDTIVAIMTNGTTGSSSEFGKFLAISPAPVAPDTAFLQEICATGSLGGSLAIDNTANSSFTYTVLFDGVAMESPGPDLFLQDSLAPGTYNMLIDYGSGCTVSISKTLVAGGIFEIDEVITDDYCGNGVGEISLSVISNTIAGSIFNDTTYSLDNGGSFQQNNTFGNLTAMIYSPQIQLEVDRNGVVDFCQASNVNSIPLSSTLESSVDLDFTFDSFCSDVSSTVSPTTIPNVSGGSFSLSSIVPAASTVSLNATSGDLTNFQDGDTYEMIYTLGPDCISSAIGPIEVYDVPDPSFNLTDFCSDGAALPANNVNTTGIFSILTQPGTENINATNGQLSAIGSEFVSGTYAIQFLTDDSECPRSSVESLEIFDKPNAMTYTSDGILINNIVLDVDSVSFCPNFSGLNSISSAFASTSWIEPDGTTFNGNSYFINYPILGTDSVYTLDYNYSITSVGSNNSVTCTSDTDSLIVFINRLPVQPDIIGGDMAYCEVPLPLTSPLTDNNSGSNTNWYLGDTNTLVLMDAQNYPAIFPYNNNLQKIYAQDSSGLGCVSEFDSTELIFLSQPQNVELTYLGSALNAGAIVTICPSYNDTIFGNVFNMNETVFWDTIGGQVTTNVFIPNDYFSPLSNNTITIYKDSTYTTGMASGPATVECTSLSDVITINVISSPIKPRISIETDTAYCFDETLANLYDLDSLATNNVLWYENSKSDLSFVSTPLDSHVISAAILYDDLPHYIYARDSTGVNCYSDYDSVQITLHQELAVPSLNWNSSTVLPISSKELVNICPAPNQTDSIGASSEANRTYWKLNFDGIADTSQYYGVVSAPLANDTLSFYRDSLYASTGKVCRSQNDTIFIDMLALPIYNSFVDTAYCEDELIDTLKANGTAIVWNQDGAITVTDGGLPEYEYPPIAPFTYGGQSQIIVYDSTGFTTLLNTCKSENDTIDIGFHMRPSPPNITLSNTSLAPDTTFICFGSTESFFADTDSADTYWYTENSINPFLTDSIFPFTGFGANSDSTVYNYTSLTYTDVVPKTCYSDTNSRIVSTYADTISPTLISGGTVAYCDNDAVDILELAGGTEVIWTESGVGSSSTFGPHQYTPTVPALYANQIDIITFRERSGITTLGVECTSIEDTIYIAYHARPMAAQLSYAGNSVVTASIDRCKENNTDEFMQSVSPAPFSYSWFVNSNFVDVLGANYNSTTLNNFNYDSDSLLNYFNTVQYNLVATKNCNSDTNQILVHTYEEPIDPVFGLDTSYCFGEFIGIVSPLNNADLHNLWWKNEQSGSTDSVPTFSNPHQYNIPTDDYTYSNAILSIFARDSTGIECYSEYDTIRVSFHSNPATPVLTLNAGGLLLPADTLIEICPTSNDTIYANIQTGISTVFKPGVNPYETTDSLRLQNRFSDLSINTINYHASQLQTLAVATSDFTCYSDTNSVFVQTYATPVEPTILSGAQNAGTVIYCEGDVVPDLFLLGNPTSAIWQRVTQAATQYGPSQVPVVPTGSFLGQTIAYTAVDSTGTGCYSSADLINLEFNPRPTGPNLTPLVSEYCEGDVLNDIFAQDANPSPLICDWYVNDTIGTPIGVDVSQITPNYNFANDTVYTFYAHLEHPTNGCWSYFQSALVTYHPAPDLPSYNFAGIDLEYCPGELLDTLIADTVVEWYYAPTFLNLTDDSLDINDIPITFAPGMMDSIQYSFVDGNTCRSELGYVSFEIFNNPITPFIFSDTTYCLGDTEADSLKARNILPSPQDSLFGTGTWYVNNGTTPISSGVSSNTFNLGVSPPQFVGDSTFYFDYIDLNGCQSELDSITIYTYDIPSAPIIDVTDSVYCEGEEILALDEQNNLNVDWYLIVNNTPDLQLANSNTYTPADSGNYIVTVVVNECESPADSVQIIIKSSPDAPIIDDMQLEYCNDQIIDTIFITSNFEGTWFNENDILNALAADTNAYLPVATVIDSITYLVNVLDPTTECYSDFDTITLYQFSSEASISTDLAEICLGFTQELEATGGVSYAWSTMDSVASIVVAPTFNTWYYVDIVDENNCILRDSIEVTLKLPASCEEQVYTAFSPNGDGVNETWEITGIELYDNPVVYIFNRWGDKIATIENYDNNLNAWDGINQANGQQVVYGTYYYIIEDGTTKVKDGWLQVVK
ncbi:MAG: gliding motility-associated C-terminal domain-containing protein [Crocinitomicaceae bacterium]